MMMNNEFPLFMLLNGSVFEYRESIYIKLDSDSSENTTVAVDMENWQIFHLPKSSIVKKLEASLLIEEED